MKTTAIIASGGVGKRFGTDIPKQYLLLKDKPIIIWALLAFEKNANIDDIIVIAQNEYWDFIKEEASKFGISKIRGFANAGAERQESVNNALKLEISENSDIILIHDAARPFINDKIINDSIAFAQKFGVAIPATRLKETIKKVDDSSFVESTIDRNSLRSIQTPQTFKKDILFLAYQNLNTENIATDDAALAERIGNRAYVFDGLEYNIKITSKIDLIIANKLLEDETFLI